MPFGRLLVPPALLLLLLLQAQSVRLSKAATIHIHSHCNNHDR